MRVGWGGHVAEGGSRHGTAERGRKRVSKRRMGSPCCPSPPTHTHIARQHALQDIGSVQAVNAVGVHPPPPSYTHTHTLRARMPCRTLVRSRQSMQLVRTTP